MTSHIRREYYYKMSEGAFIFGIKEAENERIIRVNYISRRGAKKLFKMISENDVSISHILDIVKDFAEENISEISPLYL